MASGRLELYSIKSGHPPRPAWRPRDKLTHSVSFKMGNIDQVIDNRQSTIDNYNLPFLIDKSLFMALEKRDKHTSEHCERVRLLSVALGKAMGLAEKMINVLSYAAHLHDLGKIAIPDAILLKPSALDDVEWEKMRTHSSIGAEIIESSDFPAAKEISNAVRHHHEHIDGTGYPDGLKGDQIPILSRIISVSDSYDAMTMRRAYHGTITHEHALRIMQNEKGTKLDAEILSVFTNVVKTRFF